VENTIPAIAPARGAFNSARILSSSIVSFMQQATHAAIVNHEQSRRLNADTQLSVFTVSSDGAVRGENPGGAMVDLNGHESGTGGHSQGKTYSLSGRRYLEERRFFTK
ncbi:MAG: hypothetical protein WA741_00110, partial [Candidatus Sulfotelmatobacter sp.]